MISLLLRLTVGLVRMWTHVYTWRMDPTERDARRAEIESDLWESLQDRASASDADLVARMLARLVLGVPDDLTWRATRGLRWIRALRHVDDVGCDGGGRAVDLRRASSTGVATAA